MEDVLLQIEVKAGVLPMHSPALQFDSHVRTIQTLVLNAYNQCARFLSYAASNDEVPIYQLQAGEYKEVKRLRLADYRLVVPIGLTVESFTPFSSMAKRLEAAPPILGKHPFVSMAVDDLFVITKVLKTSGELMHYLEVRQGVAGLKDAFVFDEIDHLGGYVTRNRVDVFYREQMQSEKASMLVDPDACDPINTYFANPDWANEAPPSPPHPKLVSRLLDALNKGRSHGFLKADLWIRNLGPEQWDDLQNGLEKLLPLLRDRPFRWLALYLDTPVVLWMQRTPHRYVSPPQIFKAKAVALALGGASCTFLIVQADKWGRMAGATLQVMPAPKPGDKQFDALADEARVIRERAIALTQEGEAKMKAWDAGEGAECA